MHGYEVLAGELWRYLRYCYRGSYRRLRGGWRGRRHTLVSWRELFRRCWTRRNKWIDNLWRTSGACCRWDRADCRSSYRHSWCFNLSWRCSYRCKAWCLPKSRGGISSRKQQQAGAENQQLTRGPPGYVKVSSWVLDSLNSAWHAEQQQSHMTYAAQAQRGHSQQDCLSQSWPLREV